MKAIDLLHHSLQWTLDVTLKILPDLREHPLVRSTPGGKGGPGNHTIWTLGHLAAIEGGVPHILIGESNPVEQWWPMFGIGSEPKDDLTAYPSFDELVNNFRDLRTKNIRLLEHLGEASLDRKPKNIPQGFEEEMKTIGQTFQIIAMHNMIHFGQLTDIRRAAGFKPRF